MEAKVDVNNAPTESDDGDDDDDDEYDTEADDDLGPPLKKTDLSRFSSVGAASTASSASGPSLRRVSITKQVLYCDTFEESS